MNTRMHVLVTAGNTQTPIDQVRCLTNIFTGRTGTRIALQAHQRGHSVHLLTSHPQVVRELAPEGLSRCGDWTVSTFRTFDELDDLMARNIRDASPDAVIHCAAVSDYHAVGVYAPAPGTYFALGDLSWCSQTGSPHLQDRAAKKVRSDEPELWLRLVRAPKLVDRIRSAWGFRGVLVKFKLEVGIAEEQLLAAGERSRRQSAADLMVANTLEGLAAWALLGPVAGAYQRVSRDELPERLLVQVERLHQEKQRDQ